jgi:hypothetical protein
MSGARAHVNQGVAISTSSVFLFFQHERNPFLQIISPDLSVTVFVQSVNTPVALGAGITVYRLGFTVQGSGFRV